MSINGPIIAAGPSIRKTDAATTVCNVLDLGTPPPFSTRSMVDGVITIQEFPPQWHGQMIITKGSEVQYGLMYIAVEQGDSLEWKSVNLRYVVTDIRTDKKKDPFDGFY